MELEEPHRNLQQGLLKREKTHSLARRCHSGNTEQPLLGQQVPCMVFPDYLMVTCLLSPSRGTNPFATVKLRPTVTNDRSAPIIR